jgi:hypothetical protein
MCGRGFACSQPGSGLGGEQVDQVGTGERQPGVGDGPADSREMACRVRVRKPCFVGRGGLAGPGDCGLRAGDGR